MSEEITKKLPTNLQYQRLLMARRVLVARGTSPTASTYELIKGIYHDKEALGLEFSEDFHIHPPVKKGFIEDIEKGDEYVIHELKQKIATVYHAIDARVAEVKTTLKATPEIKLKKTDLERNVEFLAEALHFNPIQKQLLEFFSCSDKGRFQAILEAAHPDIIISQEDYINSLATLLDIKNRDALQNELKPESVLVGVNFLAHDEKAKVYSVDKPLQRILANNYQSADDLLASLLGPSPTTKLVKEDYAYMADDLNDMQQTLQGYLNDTSDSPKNLTIGGPPGTGKTQITAVLAKELGARPFLVGVAEKNDVTGFSIEEPSREDRINALVRSAFIIKQTGMKALLVFDEAEDILRDLNRPGSKDEGSKAFINELLEGLKVPVVFISNRTDLFDPATTRRILPYYSMNYMPFEARMNAIVTKAKDYTGADLMQDDVKPLSKLANELSVAVIDSCISAAGQQRSAGKHGKKEVLKAIEREFTRALKAQNGGLPPVPIRESFNHEIFDPSLISANEDIKKLRAAFEKNPNNLEGKDFTIIGNTGTGRKSTAQYLATATGMEPRVIKLDYDELAKFPRHAHALDIERSALDKQPIVFDGALKFLANSDGHPFMDRVSDHPLPTFFVSDLPNSVPQEDLEQALSHLTFVTRTGNLSPEQTQEACKKLLGIDVSEAELSGIDDINIGSIVTVRKQLEVLGKEGDKKEALKRMEALMSRFKDQNKTQMGFESNHWSSNSRNANDSHVISKFTQKVDRADRDLG